MKLIRKVVKLMDKPTRADLSLYGLRDFFESKLDNMVEKKIVEGSEGRLKVLSDNNFDDKLLGNLDYCYGRVKDILSEGKPADLILITTNEGMKWVRKDTLYENDLDGIKNDIKDGIDSYLEKEIFDYKVEIKTEIHNYCTRADVKEIVSDNIKKYLINPQLVETLAKLDKALKEYHNNQTIGEFLLM